jgi:hypothetical protein
MKYLATIKLGEDSFSKSFDAEQDAQNWLDEQNNNLEHTTKIDIMDNKWNLIDSYMYTEGVQN